MLTSNSTFLELANAFLEWDSSFNFPVTVQTHRSYLNAHIFPLIQGKKIKDIMPCHFSGFYEEYHSEKITAAHAERIFATASAVFRFAIHKNILSNNPMDELPKIVVNRRIITDPFSATDEINIKQNLPYTDMKNLWGCILSSGICIHELRAVTLDEIDIDSSTIHINKRISRRHKHHARASAVPTLCPRTIILPDTAMSYIKEEYAIAMAKKNIPLCVHNNPNNFLFTTVNGTPYSCSLIQYRAKEMQLATGLPNFTAINLQTHFRFKALINGADIIDLKRFLGLKTIAPLENIQHSIHAGYSQQDSLSDILDTMNWGGDNNVS